MSDSGSELRTNNDKIVKLMTLLKRERNEMNFLITKQEEEKKQIETEIEKLTFKLSLLVKSLGQRVQARSNYDRTIKEIEATYTGLVLDSGKLLFTLTKEVDVLEEIMDKKTNTSVSLPRSPKESIAKEGSPKNSIAKEGSPKNSIPKEGSPKEGSLKESSPKERSSKGSSKRPSPTFNEEKEMPREPPPPAEKRRDSHASTASLNDTNTSPDAILDDDEDDEAEIRSLDIGEEAVNPEELVMTHNSEVARKVASSKQSLEDERPTRSRSGSRRSTLSDSSTAGRKLSAQAEPEKPPPKKAAFPTAPPIQKESESDAELQSYREAYGKQHKGASPPSSTRGSTAGRKFSKK